MMAKGTKLDRPLTVRDFLDGLDRFYDGKIEPQFVEIKQKLSEHDIRLDSIDRKLVEHDMRLGSIDQKLTEHDKKSDDIYSHIDGLYKKFEDLEIEYRVISASLDRIEKYIKQDVQDKKVVREDIAKLKSDVKLLTKRIETLEKQAAV